MKKLNISAAILPHQLSEVEREKLTDELYAVQNQIFSGVDREGFYRYVITPDTLITKLFLFQNEAKETVGYLTFHVYETQIEKKGKLKTVYAVRTETGLLKEYRGNAPLFPIMFRECIRFWFSKGFPEAYFMATPIYPAPFLITQRSFGELYPRPGIETPDSIRQVQQKLIQSLGLEQLDASGHPLVKVGWIVRQNESQRLRWEQSSDPDVQYYLQMNPGYTQGNGLMILSPANMMNVLKSTGRLLRRYLPFLKKRKGANFNLLRFPLLVPGA